MIDVTKELSGLVLLYYVLEKNIFVIELRESNRCYKELCGLDLLYYILEKIYPL